MTVHTTPVYGLGYIDTDTTMLELAAASKTLADSAEAALLRGAVAPPLPADYSSVVGRVGANETAITALTTAMRRGWTALTGVDANYSQAASSTAGALPNLSSTVVVPPGQTLEVRAHCPYVTADSGTNGNAQLWVNGAVGIGGGWVWSTATGATEVHAVTLHGQYKNTGTTDVTVPVAFRAVRITGNITFAGGGVCPPGIMARLL